MDLTHLRDAAATPADFGLFSDFVSNDAAVDANGPFDFVAIASGTFATQAANGGWIRISGVATTDDSGGQIQACGAHACTDGKVLNYKARAQLNESTSTNVATESDAYFGLLPVDTSIVASFPADGIFFKKIDGGTAIVCVVRVGSTDVYSQTITPVMDKLVHTYGIAIWPDSTNGAHVEFSIDGVVVARAQGSTITLPATTVYLTPSVAFQTGDATGTKWLDVDYVGSYQKR